MMTDSASRDPGDYLTYEDAAQHLAHVYKVELTPETIRNKVSVGEIPWRRVAGHRRILRSELDAWALGETEPATEGVA